MAATKVPQVLQLTPDNEITFEGPFDHVVTSYLELHNPSDKRVCFKVKTTAPRRYCVRPNSGLIEPSKSVKISIMLQPLENEDTAERNRHKFMVQSTYVTDDEVKVEKVWETAQKVMDSKLRCVFRDRPLASTTEEEGDNDISIATKAQTTSTTTQTAQTSNEPQKVPTEAAASAANTIKENTSRNKTEPLITSPLTSTPSASASKNWGANISSQNLKRGTSGKANVSIGSTSTSSFLQPVNDDYKMVLVSLVMLFIGVILGKYIM